MKVDFEVKEKSVSKWFKDNSRHKNVNEFDSCNRESVSVYHLLQDSLIMDLLPFTPNEVVRITLSDESRNSNKKLINTYIYKVCEYDDVSCELKLIDFKIELKK